MINTDPKKIEEILNRGVEEVFERESLKKKLKSGKQLKIKLGIDPTGPKIHIGRALQFWKLKEFQDLGHKIVLIIGDFTALIGDASDKQAMRKPLTEKEIRENMKNYAKQIGKILDMKKVEIYYNSDWFLKMRAKDLLSLSMIFTAQQMIQRRNFKERWDSGKPIGLHELNYPLLQGYDSVATKADVEIGGTDQLFNLQAGREIQKFFKQNPQDIMTLKMLSGLDGRKMSTSWGNIITIVDAPHDMYGKIMSIRDELMGDYFELCTKISLNCAEKIKEFVKREIKGDLEEFKIIKEELEIKELNERNLKSRLAKEIVKMYHGEKLAEKAEEEFNKIFRDKQTPSEIEVFKTDKKIYPVLDLLCDTKLALSKSEAKRLVEGGAVEISEKVLHDWRVIIEIKDGMIIKVGKRKFLKIKNK